MSDAQYVKFPQQCVLLFVGLWTGCGESSVNQLARDLRHPAVDVRRKAATELVEMGGEAKPAVAALTESLQDKDREVRRLASRALGRIGSDAAPSLKPLCDSLRDEELSVRLAAAFAIQEIDPTEKSHTAVLIDAMKMGEGGVIVAVGKYGERAAWAVPTLANLLKDHRPGIRRISADALRQIGPAAGEAEQTLQHVVKMDTDDRVRDAARQAIAALQGMRQREFAMRCFASKFRGDNL